MLDRPRPPACIVCDRPFGDPSFTYDEAEPAYWSDQGLLCSVACCQEHARRRRKQGDAMTVPAENPLDHLFDGSG